MADTNKHDTDVTLGAAAIIDIVMGGDKSWRKRIGKTDFLESADWLTAMEYSKAVIEATRAK